MNAQQMEVRTLRAENMRLRHAFNEKNLLDRLLIASLTGASAQFEDPAKAAQYALQASGILMNELVPQQAEETTAAAPETDPAPPEVA